MIYIRRRLAMCARKLGKLKEVSQLIFSNAFEKVYLEILIDCFLFR